MLMCLKLKENAIFVADAHYNEKRGEFLIFLKKVQNSSIQITQLFLMGDMFDFLSSQNSYFIKKNQELIDLINELSYKHEVFYLEGNHDYNLVKLFPKVKVYTRASQPVLAQYNNKTIAISHGDIFVDDMFYEMFCKVIRNKIFLKFLNIIDINNMLSKKVYYSLLEKDICHKIDNFKEITQKRLKYYSSDIIIEGHFHQGNEYIFKDKRYKNIPSLTCSKQYTKLKDNVFIEIDLKKDL